jgi:hypothetical protein
MCRYDTKPFAQPEGFMHTVASCVTATSRLMLSTSSWRTADTSGPGAEVGAEADGPGAEAGAEACPGAEVYGPWR